MSILNKLTFMNKDKFTFYNRWSNLVSDIELYNSSVDRMVKAGLIIVIIDPN